MFALVLVEVHLPCPSPWCQPEGQTCETVVNRRVFLSSRASHKINCLTLLATVKNVSGDYRMSTH